MQIRHATTEDLEQLIPLFEGYRKFYRQEANPDGARQFLKERLEHNESLIFLAFAKTDSEPAIGFTQIYPLFSSVSMERMLLLNDLYIHPDYRGQGVGTALIDTVKELCKAQGQKGIALQKEANNPAQKLYEQEGFKKDPDLHYFWARE